MHDMHKLYVDVTFMRMTFKEGTKNHGKRVVEAMYNKYTQLEYMKIIGELDPGSLKISQKKGELRSINLIK